MKTLTLNLATDVEEVVLKYVEEKADYLINESYEEGYADYLKCESAIEKLLLLALKDFFKNANYFNGRYEYVVTPQAEINYKNKKYRADILLNACDFVQEKHVKFAIECDGHEFHEKTKEQVRRDRSRERDLMKLGYTVIRFSGSEIVESPDECALEVWEVVKVRLGL